MDLWLPHHRRGALDLVAGFTLHACPGTVTIQERDMTVERIISGGRTGAAPSAPVAAIPHCRT